ncbi:MULTISPECIES: NUDIX domain-containing protein [Streptomyces]|uniref:NUDIX domain-containing protein n=1 Tax=Streptomyces TaxID=1883 RepID=UPI0034D6EC44
MLASVCEVHLLVRDNQLLLSLRKGGYDAGLWQVLAGHLAAREPAHGGTAREGLEEIGVRVASQGLEFAHFIHRPPGEEPRLGAFYQAMSWEESRTTQSRTSAAASSGARSTRSPTTKSHATPGHSPTSPAAAYAPTSHRNLR